MHAGHAGGKFELHMYGMIPAEFSGTRPPRESRERDGRQRGNPQDAAPRGRGYRDSRQAGNARIKLEACCELC